MRSSVTFVSVLWLYLASISAQDSSPTGTFESPVATSTSVVNTEPAPAPVAVVTTTVSSPPPPPPPTVAPSSFQPLVGVPSSLLPVDDASGQVLVTVTTVSAPLPPPTGAPASSQQIVDVPSSKLLDDDSGALLDDDSATTPGPSPTTLPFSPLPTVQPTIPAMVPPPMTLPPTMLPTVPPTFLLTTPPTMLLTTPPSILLTTPPSMLLTVPPTIPLTAPPTIQPFMEPPLTSTVKPPVWSPGSVPQSPTLPPSSVQQIDGTSLSPAVVTQKPFMPMAQQPNTTPTDNSGPKNGWIKPAWWDEYRKKFSKRQMKKCTWLYGIIPTSGSKCPRKGNGGKYICMFGEKSCLGISAPLPDFPDITAISLGNNHPETRCTCGDDRLWSCDNWNVCAR